MRSKLVQAQIRLLKRQKATRVIKGIKFHEMKEIIHNFKFEFKYFDSFEFMVKSTIYKKLKLKPLHRK